MKNECFLANTRSLFSWLGTLNGVKGRTSDFLQRQTWHANFKCGALCKVRQLKLERLNHRFLMWLAAKTQRGFPSLDYQSLMDHFRCQSVKARMMQADITFMRSIFSGRIACIELVSKFSLVAPVRRSRHTGLFHVPFGRVNAVKRSLLSDCLAC